MRCKPLALARTSLACLACLAVCAAMPGPAQAADPVTTRQVARHRVAVDFGWDPTWTVGVGYSHGLRGRLGGHDARLGLRFDAPISTLHTMSSWRVAAQWTMLFRFPYTLGVAVSADAGVVYGRDPTGRKIGWSSELAVQPGSYWRAWSLGLDLRWRSVPLLALEHSARVASTFEDRYPDGDGHGDGPRNGLLAFPSHKLLLGVAAGGAIVDRVGLFARGGFAWQPQRQRVVNFPALGQLPFYLQVGVDARW